MTSRATLFLLIACAFAAVLPGCATTTNDRRVDILYQPAANATGGSGTINLVQGGRSASQQATNIQWVLGQLTDSDGKKTGNVVTSIAPASLAMDALNQELKKAGYQVVQPGNMPADAKKGVSLNDVTIKLDETDSTLKNEAKCSVRLSLQPWRDGSAVSTVSYEAEYSESAVTDRDQLLNRVLQKALQLVMTRSVPEIVTAVEQKSPAVEQKSP